MTRDREYPTSTLDKVRKLMALTQSPNKHKAAAAKAKATALIREHGLTMNDVAEPATVSIHVVHAPREPTTVRLNIDQGGKLKRESR